MFSQQATSPVIRARNQAVIRIGGEQGRAAVLSCFLASCRACGLFAPLWAGEEGTAMSSDTLPISNCSQATGGNETSKRSKSNVRLRHRVETYRADGFRCVYCGKDLLADSDALLMATVDHIVPRAAGGGNGEANRATCCSACNRLKDCRRVTSIEEGRQVIARQRTEELARFREALGELTPPRSPEFVALAAAVERFDPRTLAGQTLQLTLLARQEARRLGRLAYSLRQWADGVHDLRSATSATCTKRRGPLWELLWRLIG